jgi:hypothetical protein
MAALSVKFGDYVPEELNFPEDKGKVNFTFNVFIDGTLNNLENSKARIEYNKSRGSKADDAYRDYGKVNTSYDNDYSNVALLKKACPLDDNTNKVYYVYVEGIGTTDLEADSFDAYSLDWGKTSIRAKVHKAIDIIVKKITKQYELKIGTITMNVFGFSRGAAAARHLVHEVTLPRVYEVDPTTGFRREEPAFGRLGKLLEDKKRTIDYVKINFAGLFDSVAHHGLVQWNDVQDLGLATINTKAKFIVHFCAGNEHRANFNLTTIQEGKNRIQKFLPGVHCDVGGSYVEGRPEKVAVIAFSTQIKKMEQRYQALVAKGWFKHDELSIKQPLLTNFSILSSSRKKLSNQYSYIPLHFMAELARNKGAVNIQMEYLKSKYAFSNEHKVFLTRIMNEKLRPYVFEDGKPFVMLTEKDIDKSTIQSPIPNMNLKIYEADKWKHRSDGHIGINKEDQLREEQYQSDMVTVQQQINNELDRLNADLKKLRNEYLHWNADFKDPLKTSPHRPNLNRKRDILNG